MTVDLRQNAFYYNRRCKKPSIFYFAKRAQEDLVRECIRIGKEVSLKLGIVLKPKNEATQYEYTKALKEHRVIKIHRRAFILTAGGVRGVKPPEERPFGRYGSKSKLVVNLKKRRSMKKNISTLLKTR